MNAAIAEAAKKLTKKTGIPLAASQRIVRKMNLLAHRVNWAQPIEERQPAADVTKHRKIVSNGAKLLKRSGKSKRH